MNMIDLEYEAIEILRSGEPLPVDIYIYLNNSGIDPDYLINLFIKEEQLEPTYKELEPTKKNLN